MKRLCSMLAVMATLVYGVAFAQEDLTQENAQLRQRVDSLEHSVGELKSELAKQGTPAAGAEKIPVWSTVSIQLYGYIKLDASYDTARVDEGNYIRSVESKETSDEDEFNMTARQSRFGLNLSGPDIAATKTSGKVEIDFYGGGTENKNVPMMRHAYLKVEWPKIDFGILAGQTSDTCSPLFPNTLNYVVGWWAGNPGYRRPQVRLTKGFGKDVRFLIETAAARTIGHSEPFSDLVDTGEDAGFPSTQARCSLSFPLLTNKKTTLGVSGHYGKEEYEYVPGNENIDTWSVNLDVTLPIFDWLTFQGEVWRGEDLDSYLAGIGQGIVVRTDKKVYINPPAKIEGTFISAYGIASTGGWGSFNCGPFGPWRLNVGAGIDDPNNKDIPITGAGATKGNGKTQNVSVWGNVTYDIHKAVQVGVELSYWNTQYQEKSDGNDVRVQTSLIYKF